MAGLWLAVTENKGPRLPTWTNDEVRKLERGDGTSPWMSRVAGMAGRGSAPAFGVPVDAKDIAGLRENEIGSDATAFVAPVLPTAHSMGLEKHVWTAC
jgi:hypothetical protein